MKLITLMVLAFSFQGIASFESTNILSSKQIATIINDKNYFQNKDWSNPGSYVWDYSKLEYSLFFYKHRKESLSYNQALDLSMKRMMDIAINLQTLTQARMNIHLAVGDLLPSLNLPFGQGADYGASGLFKGIFGFVLPQQWLRLKHSKLSYKLAKLSLLKASLDHYMQNRMTLYEIHRTVTRFEIESFFFTHLELFVNHLRNTNPRGNDILQAISRSIATDMAETGNRLGIRFNDLAFISNIFRDTNKRLASDSIRLGFMKEYMKELPKLSDLGVAFKNRDTFVRESLQRSIEMIIIKNLVKVAKLNIGITVMGDFTLEDNAWDFSSDFQFGYGTIPATLKASADKKIAKIEVSKELQSFLDLARRAYGNYQNALRLWNNALEQKKIAQTAFYALLEEVLTDPSKASPLAILTISSLYNAELRLNNAIHDAWKAKAQMDRFMRHDENIVMSYLPKTLDIKDAIDNLEKFVYQENWDVKEINELVTSIRKTADLKAFLGGNYQLESGLILRKSDCLAIVKTHLSELLSSKNRSRHFFSTLKDYFTQKKIHLTKTQTNLLEYNIKKNRLQRVFHRL